jgi:hypothetical protein
VCSWCAHTVFPPWSAPDKAPKSGTFGFVRVENVGALGPEDLVSTLILALAVNPPHCDQWSFHVYGSTANVSTKHRAQCAICLEPHVGLARLALFPPADVQAEA